jgi:hypothetical protein
VLLLTFAYAHWKIFYEDVNVYYVMLYEILQSPICTVGGFSTFLYPKILSFSRNSFSEGYRLFSSTTESTANNIDPWKKNGKIQPVPSQHTQDEWVYNQGILRDVLKIILKYRS